VPCDEPEVPVPGFADAAHYALDDAVARLEAERYGEPPRYNGPEA
jgi:hypothetical protein